VDAFSGATESTTDRPGSAADRRSATRRPAAETRGGCYGFQWMGLPSVGVLKTDSSTSGVPLAVR
jgi:hypothetical protein